MQGAAQRTRGLGGFRFDPPDEGASEALGAWTAWPVEVQSLIIGEAPVANDRLVPDAASVMTEVLGSIHDNGAFAVDGIQALA